MTTLKTYRAPTMALALAEVKKDLGKDAVIVNTRSTKAGGWMGLGAKPMIEITATGPAPAPRRTDPIKPGEPAKAPSSKPAPKAPAPRAEPAARGPVPTQPTKSSIKLVVEPHPVPENKRVLGDADDDEWTPIRLGTAIFLNDPDDPEHGADSKTRPGAGPAVPATQPVAAVAPKLAEPGRSALPARDPLDSAHTSALEFKPVEAKPEPAAPTPAAKRAIELIESSIATFRASSPEPQPVDAAAGFARPPAPAPTEPAVPGPAVSGAPISAPAASSASTPTLPTSPPAAPAPLLPTPRSASTPASAIEDELASLKRLMGQVLRYSRDAALDRVRGASAVNTTGLLSSGNLFSPAGPAQSCLLDIYTALVDAGMPADLVDDIVAGVQTDLISGLPANRAGLREITLRRVARAIPVVTTPAHPGRQPDGRPLTIALVGPTGVGKTTTIAKLAAQYKLRQGKSVGLITTDTYRIAAVEQLRTYAKIIQLPLKIAEDAQDVAEASAELGGCDVVIIDTAGRSPTDHTRLGELSTAIRLARPHETHLVLAATAAEPVLLRTIERFRGLAPDRLILTKLDETAGLGAIASVPAKANLPVSYITAGQEVPDDIEAADAMRLAQRIAPDLMFGRPLAAELAPA